MLGYLETGSRTVLTVRGRGGGYGGEAWIIASVALIAPVMAT
jgi:hypothetical protein